MSEIVTITRAERRAKAKKDLRATKAKGAFKKSTVVSLLALSLIGGSTGLANAAVFDDSRQIPSISGWTPSPEVAAELGHKVRGTAPVWKPTPEQKAAFAKAGYNINWDRSNEVTAERNTPEDPNFEAVLVMDDLDAEYIKAQHPSTANLINDGQFRYGPYLETKNWNATTVENIDAGDTVAGEVDRTPVSGAVNNLLGNPLYGTGIDPHGDLDGLPEGEVAGWVIPTQSNIKGGVAGDIQYGTSPEESMYKNTLVLDPYELTEERLADTSMGGTQRVHDDSVISCVAEGTKCYIAFQGWMEGTGDGSVHLADGTVYPSMAAFNAAKAEGKIPKGMQYSVDDQHRRVATTDVMFIELDYGLYFERSSLVGEENAVTTNTGGKVSLAPISKAAEVGQFLNDGTTNWGRNFFNLGNNIYASPEPAKQTASIDLETQAEGTDFRINVKDLVTAPDSATVVKSWSYKVDAQGNPVEGGNYELTSGAVSDATYFGLTTEGKNEAKNFVLTASIADSRYKDKWEVPADLYTGRKVKFGEHDATIKVLENSVGEVDKYPYMANNTVRFLVSFDTVPEYFSFASDNVPLLSAGVSAYSKATAIEFAPGYKAVYTPGKLPEIPPVEEVPTPEKLPEIPPVETVPTPEETPEKPNPDSSTSIIPEKPGTSTTTEKEPESTGDSGSRETEPLAATGTPNPLPLVWTGALLAALGTSLAGVRFFNRRQGKKQGA